MVNPKGIEYSQDQIEKKKTKEYYMKKLEKEKEYLDIFYVCAKYMKINPIASLKLEGRKQPPTCLKVDDARFGQGLGQYVS